MMNLVYSSSDHVCILFFSENLHYCFIALWFHKFTGITLNAGTLPETI